MNEEQLNEITGRFTGNIKEDMESFQSILEQYKGSPDAVEIYNRGINVLIDELNDDQKEEFFDHLRKAGLGKYIKPEEPVKLGSVPDEDVIKLKKVIITGKDVKHKPLNFKKAVSVGKPLVFSAPKELVDQLRQSRKEYMESHKEENEE